MSVYMDAFTSHMDQKGVRYSVESENRVRISYSGDNADSIVVNAFFDKDGEGKVQFIVWHLGKFSESRLAAGMAACNALNAKWRWVKFYLDSDNEGCADCDALLDESSAGEECMELLLRIVDIVDKAYPDLMRALYA